MCFSKQVLGFVFLCSFFFSSALALAEKSVLILGGGVAGLSAAHELVERGYKVTIYESNTTPEGTDASGEHDFRFFPGFYRHITDTMKRIPYKDNKEGVFSNLIPVTKLHLEGANHPNLTIPIGFSITLDDFTVLVKLFLEEKNIHVSLNDLLYFSTKLYVLATSHEDRRRHEYEKISWWNFIDAGGRSEDYRKHLAIGLTKSLVTTKPQKISARTAGYTLLQLIYTSAGISDGVDRTLNGSANETWIHPWLAYLKEKGVSYITDSEVKKINVIERSVASVDVEVAGELKTLTADHYISAVPAKVMRTLLTPEMLKVAPYLDGIEKLETDEPLMINTVGSWYHRPHAVTKISNFYFAADYVQTNTDLATIESANEAARRAVNGILGKDKNSWPKAKIWEMHDPAIFDVAKAHDEARYVILQPHWLLQTTNVCDFLLKKSFSLKGFLKALR